MILEFFLKKKALRRLLRGCGMPSGILFICFAIVLSANSSQVSASQFTPTSSWLVGPALVSNQQEGSLVPCVMFNRFDNGYSMRFSGGNQTIYAMAVDFRQTVFTPGQTYKISLSLSSGFKEDVPAAAHDPGTLLINTRALDNFHEELKDSQTLRLAIDNHYLDFSLVGIKNGLRRMADCHGGYDAPRMAEGNPESSTGKGLSNLSSDHRKAFPVADDVLAALQQEDDPERDSVLSSGGDSDEEKFRPVWEPPKHKTNPQKPSRPDREKDIVVNYDSESAESSGAADSRVQVRRWRAIRGASLRETLQNWSGQSNVRLIWQAGKDFQIEESLSVQGVYEDAVQTLLSQYDSTDIKPRGRLYNDPEGLAGAPQKVLVVELQGESVNNN